MRALVAAEASADGVTWPAPRRAFLATVAEVARANPPGTAHEIATPCPYVRHILIVPEP